MKKIFITTLFMVFGFISLMAQGSAEITFEKTKHNFGAFPESSPKVSCIFKFKNTGDKPLIIHQAIASCGCTIPTYTKKPLQPGESGEIRIVYDGTGKFPGHFRKSIAIRSNATKEIVRLVVEGDMTPTPQE